MGPHRLIKRFWADEVGATAVEYGLICGIIAVVVFGIAATGGALSNVYNKLIAVIDALGGGGEPEGG